MKTKYEVLDNEKKRQIKDGLYKTQGGRKFKANITMSVISSSICFLYGLFIIISNIYGEKTTIDYVYGAMVSIAGIFLLCYARVIYLKRLNLYILKNKRK